ncbi:MAG: polysaccharide biosynthesis C-terminal domain-containing protein, partial [Deltaproteobacteria bacterium]|nr:polysaccharide biosynthesis C-terminal domain-containing protein [Deltaproteobacteria bacterium]
LQAYTLGLAGYACIKVLAPSFYALDLPRTPVRISLIGIALNIILNYIFIFVMKLGVLGLAMSTSLVAIINVLQLASALRSRIGAYGGMWGFSARIALSSIIMGLAVYGLRIMLEPHLTQFWGNFSLIVITISVGVAVFLFAAWILKMKELHMLLPILRKR